MYLFFLSCFFVFNCLLCCVHALGLVGPTESSSQNTPTPPLPTLKPSVWVRDRASWRAIRTVSTELHLSKVSKDRKQSWAQPIRQAQSQAERLNSYAEPIRKACWLRTAYRRGLPGAGSQSREACWLCRANQKAFRLHRAIQRGLLPACVPVPSTFRRVLWELSDPLTPYTPFLTSGLVTRGRTIPADTPIPPSQSP